MSVPPPSAKAAIPPRDGVTLTPADGDVPVADNLRRLGVPAPRPAVVLVVDDEVSVLIATRRILTRYGYTVLEAAGGEAALRVASENAALIDVVLTDVRMPGLDGPALVARLSGILRTLRVVYTSGYTDGRLEQELSTPGCVFLPKPFTIEQLTRTLAELLA